MKSILILSAFILTATICSAQYTKEKLTTVLTGGSSKEWVAKGSETSYKFNKDNTVAVNGKPDKWELTSPDNIRWFITIGGDKQEIIVSYDKGGAQFIKLTRKDPGSSLYTEQILYSAK